MSEIERRPTDAIYVPVEGEIVNLGTGEAVDLNDPVSCGLALDALRQFERGPLADAKRALTEAVLARYRLTGERTLELNDALYAEVSGGTRSTFDADALEAGLRAAGLPEENIDALITETVERKVDGRKARALARANPGYAAAVEDATTTYEERVSVSIRRKP